MNIQSIESEINSCLCIAAKRQYGLIKLSTHLERCSNSSIEEHGLFWYRTLLQIIENHPITLHAKLAHFCLYLLISQSKLCNAEFNKQFSTVYVEKIISTLLTKSQPLTKNSLICLFELMTHYTKACSQYKNKIETFVLSKLESNSSEIVDWSAKCFSKLPNLHKNVSNSDVWYTYFSNALCSANTTLDLIFEEQITDQHNQSIATQIFKTSLNKDSLTVEDFYGRLNDRFMAACKCLRYLFVYCDDHIAKIRVNEVVQFMRRLFTFDLKRLTLNHQNLFKAEYKQMLLIIGNLNKSVMELAQDFFHCLKSNLISTSNTISKIFAAYCHIAFEDVLIDALPTFYDTITEWINVLGVNSGFYKSLSYVLDNLLENIKPMSNLLTLDIKNDKQQNAVKKRVIEQQTNNMLNNKNLKKNSFNRYDRKVLSKSSLKCLCTIIKYFQSQFTLTELNKIQSTVVNLLISVQQNYSNKDPYSNEECRFLLYENLFQLCLCVNKNVCAPICVGITIFSNAKNDCSHHITNYAQQCLFSLRAFVSPIMPIDYHEYQDKANFLTTKMPVKVSNLDALNGLVNPFAQQQQQPHHLQSQQLLQFQQLQQNGHHTYLNPNESLVAGHLGAQTNGIKSANNVNSTANLPDKSNLQINGTVRIDEDIIEEVVDDEDAEYYEEDDDDEEMDAEEFFKQVPTVKPVGNVAQNDEDSDDDEDSDYDEDEEEEESPRTSRKLVSINSQYKEKLFEKRATPNRAQNGDSVMDHDAMDDEFDDEDECDDVDEEDEIDHVNDYGEENGNEEAVVLDDAADDNEGTKGNRSNETVNKPTENTTIDNRDNEIETNDKVSEEDSPLTNTNENTKEKDEECQQDGNETEPVEHDEPTAQDVTEKPVVGDETQVGEVADDMLRQILSTFNADAKPDAEN